MRINVNLATRPFVELRPFFLRLRIIMAALALAAIVLFIVDHAMARRFDRARADFDQVHTQLVDTQQERNRAQASMTQPANAAVLERARFLNDLFLRKSFSWTAVMMDLETVLPVGVQVTSIEPQVTAEGDVIIHLRVSGDRDRAVQLVRNLERSRRFLQPRLVGESSQAKENGAPAAAPAAAPGKPAGVEFDILANYNPLPANEPYRFARVKEETQPDSAEPSAPGARSVIAPHVTSARPPYPRDGVVLRPYTGVSSPPPVTSPAPVATPATLRGPGIKPHTMRRPPAGGTP